MFTNCISKLSSVFDKSGLGSKSGRGQRFSPRVDNVPVSCSFFLSLFFDFMLCYVMLFILLFLMYTKNILILLLFYLFQLFFHKNYFNFFMLWDVPECFVMFRVPRFIDGRILFRLADRA